MDQRAPTRSLIVNADDFGLAPAVNRGIVEAFKKGILTSASLMANTPFLADALELAESCPGLGLGFHLNLTSGSPLCAPAELDSLVDSSGKLPGTVRLAARVWRPEVRQAIRREMVQQIEKLLSHNVDITHIDGHKHIHVHPVILPLTIAAAKDYGIWAIRVPAEGKMPTRSAHSAITNRARTAVVTVLAARARGLVTRAGLVTTDHFLGIARTGDWDPESMSTAIGSLKPGVTELMVHPGHLDDELRGSGTRLLESRQAELNALVSEDVREAVRISEVQLINFRNLYTQT